MHRGAQACLDCSAVTLGFLEPENCSQSSTVSEECSASLLGMSQEVLKA